MAAAKAAEGQGDTRAAEKMYEGAVEAARKSENNDKALSQTLMALGSLYYRQGQYKQAEHLFEDLVPVEKRLKGPTDPSVSALLLKLGNCTTSSNKSLAKTRFVEARNIMEKNLPENDPAIADVVVNIAGIQASGGYYLSAEKSFKEAMAMYDANNPQANKDIRRKLIDALNQYANTLHLNDQGGRAKKVEARIDELKALP